MVDFRACVQCGTRFEPRREHARFCSSQCRVTWNREHAIGQLNGDTPLDWSIMALEDTAGRLVKASGVSPAEALALVSEAVWWVTLVDATMVRYHPGDYDHALTRLDPAARRVTEGTFSGLRFVRNWMGYHLDPADFVEPGRDGDTGDTPVATWTWRPIPAPDCASMPPRGRSWETTRHQHYRMYLADQSVGETITRTTTFLAELAPGALGSGPSPSQKS
jgi:hypothetical protein